MFEPESSAPSPAVVSSMPEAHVDSKRLAALMGVSVRTVARFTAAGMPSENWGMKRTRRYLPSACLEWARTRQDQKVESLLYSTSPRLTVVEQHLTNKE